MLTTQDVNKYTKRLVQTRSRTPNYIPHKVQSDRFHLLKLKKRQKRKLIGSIRASEVAEPKEAEPKEKRSNDFTVFRMQDRGNSKGTPREF